MLWVRGQPDVPPSHRDEIFILIPLSSYIKLSMGSCWMGDHIKSSKASSWMGDHIKSSKASSWMGDHIKSSKASSWMGDHIKSSKASSWMGDEINRRIPLNYLFIMLIHNAELKACSYFLKCATYVLHTA